MRRLAVPDRGASASSLQTSAPLHRGASAPLARGADFLFIDQQQQISLHRVLVLQQHHRIGTHTPSFTTSFEGALKAAYGVSVWWQGRARPPWRNTDGQGGAHCSKRRAGVGGEGPSGEGLGSLQV